MEKIRTNPLNPFHPRSYRFCLILVIGSILLSDCQSPVYEPLPADYEYVPLETGRYVIYDVQEQQFHPNSPPDQHNYQVKEVIGKTYVDVTGQMAYRLFRYRRPTDNQPWQADSAWSVRILNQEAIRTENSSDFVTLVVPVSEALTWNGNRYNALEPEAYTIRNVGLPYRVQDKQFATTLTVTGQTDSTLVSENKRLSVYARQVGLIYKEVTHVQYCTSSPACVGRYQIEYGSRQIYRIRSYGTE
ncbi:hypothetical protein [Spirosoma areae]